MHICPRWRRIWRVESTKDLGNEEGFEGVWRIEDFNGEGEDGFETVNLSSGFEERRRLWWYREVKSTRAKVAKGSRMSCPKDLKCKESLKRYREFKSTLGEVRKGLKRERFERCEGWRMVWRSIRYWGGDWPNTWILVFMFEEILQIIELLKTLDYDLFCFPHKAKSNLGTKESFDMENSVSSRSVATET